MTAMDLERTMEFILQQQARLEGSVLKHDEQLARLEASVQKHDDQIAAVTDLVGRLAQAEIRLVERVDKLGARMDQFFERMDRFIQGLEGDGHKT